MSLSPRIFQLAERIWNYHLLHHELEKADCVFALGCHDADVGAYAAELIMKGWADTLLISGGVPFDPAINDKTEAIYFKEIAIRQGVPEEKIITENKATNTGENFIYAGTLLREMNLDYRKFIVVQKPYMERRTFATGKVQWKDKQLILASRKTTFTDYLSGGISEDRIINTMVGDLQRIKYYPEKGFQVPQEIPDNIWEAFEELVGYGYNKRLIMD